MSLDELKLIKASCSEQVEVKTADKIFSTYLDVVNRAEILSRLIAKGVFSKGDERSLKLQLDNTISIIREYRDFLFKYGTIIVNGDGSMKYELYD